MNRRTRLLIAEILGPLVVIIAVWFWTANSEIHHFPPLSEVLSAFSENWIFDQVASDLIPSLWRLLAGFAIAVLVGAAVGLVLGQSFTLRRMTHPIVEFLRSLPAPALIPFTMLVFGIGDTSKVFLIAFVCVWPVLLNTMDGVSDIEPNVLETAKMYRIRLRDRVRKVLLPAVMPRIFAGMRTALALAFILMVVSEMMGGTNGIGFAILDAQRNFNIVDMWAGIVMLGLLGYVFNAILLLIESKVLAWHRGLHEGAR